MKQSDAKAWLIKMQKVDGRGYSSIHSIGGVVRPAFEMPMVALHWEHYFKHIRTKYNKIYRIQLPKITPHVCRHTFCSNMAKSGMNPKTLQYIMGHSDIGITLDTYTHLKIEDAQEEFDRCLEA